MPIAITVLKHLYLITLRERRLEKEREKEVETENKIGRATEEVDRSKGQRKKGIETKEKKQRHKEKKRVRAAES